MKIYMAGPLFTAAERMWNRELASILRKFSHEVFLPQESKTNNTKVFNSEAIFKEDVKGIEWSDVVLGWCDGSDPDSGTCWELAYAKGKNKLTIGYTTDLRFQAAAWGRYDLNLMITYGVDKFLRFKPDVEPYEVFLMIIDAIGE